MTARLLRRSLALVLPLVTAACLVPAADGAVELRHTYAGPITPTSPCTAEPRNAIYNNTAFNPSAATSFFNGVNLPSVSDVVSATQAGAVADLCVGYALTPDLTPNPDNPALRVTRSGAYTPAPSDPFDPTTAPESGDDQRNVDVVLPAGVAARLAAVPTCSDAQFGPEFAAWQENNDPDGDSPGNGEELLSTCPAASQVGEATVRGSLFLAAWMHAVLGTGRPGSNGECLGIDGKSCPPIGRVFNLVPSANELGRMGVQVSHPTLAYPVRFTVSLRLATDGSGRVVAQVRNAPRFTNQGRSPYAESVALRVWGSAAAHPTLPADFAETATQCATAASADVRVETHGGPPVFDYGVNSFLPNPAGYVPTISSQTTAGVQMTGCDQLPFAPAVDVDVAERRPGVPTAATVRVRVDQAAVGGRLPSHVKDASVTLPAGLELGGQVASDADGLQFCSAAQFAASDSSVAAACAAATEAASVAITSPLISRQFTGKVFLGEPASGDVLPQLFLEATLAGSSGAGAPRIKLVGSVSADADGRLTTVFRDAPQLRFSELTLSFPGGDHALFSTAPRCGSTSGSARMSPWSGQPDVSVATSAVVIDEGCASAAAPKISVAASNPKAGAKSPVSVTIERDSSAPWMDSVNAHLPPGFLADLNAAAECPAADAATGNCGADSKIGTVTTWAGAGTKPYEISGDLFLAERKGNDVAGAVIVVDAKVGDLDLGKVVVPGRILLRPTDAGLDFISDVPLRVEGVALQLQKVQVDLNRPNFALNPSACGPLEASVELTDDQSVVTTGTGQATYTGCRDLGFAPKLQAILTGDNTPGGHPGMYVVLTSPEGDAGMKSAAVTLPDGVVVDLANAKSACTVAQFNSSSCPVAAKIGTAKADVSIVPEQLTGSIFLVAVPGKSLPGLGLDFGGRYAQRVLATTATDKDSRVVTTFASIPDLPLRRLVIDVASSAKSPLQVSETSPCDANSGWQGVFTAQGGQTATSKTGLQCAAKPKTALSAKGGLSFRLFDFGTRNLSYLKISLPKGWSINAKAAKRPDAIWVRTTGGTATVKLAKRSVFVNATGKTTDVRLKISAAVLKGPRKLRKGSTVTLPVRLAFTDGTIQQQTLSIALN